MADQLRFVSEKASALLHQPSIRTAEGLDTNEFLSFYDEFFPRVYNYVRFRCGDGSITDDLTSVVFEKALLKFGDYDPQRGPFGGWLFGIARNSVNTYLRAAKKQNCLPLDTLNERHDIEPLPEEKLIQSETKEELLAAFSQLGERDRDLLSLKFAGHLTNRRIAEITHLSESNVAIILHRALHKLRIALERKDR